MKTCSLCGRTGTHGFAFDFVSRTYHCVNINACIKRQKNRTTTEAH